MPPGPRPAPGPRVTPNPNAAAKLAPPPAKDRSNPLFLYPSPGAEGVARSNDSIGAVTIQRGYVRRLTEFYKRTSGGSTPGAGTTLGNLKCNFQFNPETITRSIQSDTSMQFFFNQEPNQLTQPIPGQATFAFRLRFNREAEVYSGKYLAGDKLVKGKPAKNTSSAAELASQIYIDKEYNPAWVTAIGVLADIMVLDDILGVGLSQDIVNASKANALLMPPTQVTVVDPTDATKTETKNVYDTKRMSDFTSNLGNKAFLVPQPIRVVFSDWMMVEGFVTSSQVDFQKYSRGFVPTVCEVYVTMQALYVGFTQAKTFLTDITVDPNTNTGGEGTADFAPEGTAERALQEATIAGMANFIKSAVWVKGQWNDLSVKEFLNKGEQKVKNINFTIIVSNKGAAFYKSIGSSKEAGGGVEFTFSGTIKISWHSHVNNASNSRAVGGGEATSASALTYTSGAPPDTNSAKYSQYGTAASPLVISINDHPIKYKVDVDRGIAKTEDVMVYGKNPTYRYFSEGNDAAWTWELGSDLSPRPFNQDKFNVELEITTYCSRAGLGNITLPQKIKMKSTGIQYNNVMGMTKLTVNK